MILTRYVLPSLAMIGAVFAVGYVTVRRSEPPSRQPSMSPPTAVFGSAVHGAGVVEGRGGNIEVGSPIDGIVIEVAVRPGDNVARGVVLFRLDDDEAMAQMIVRQREVAVAKGNVTEAHTIVADAQDESGRIERLARDTGVSERRLAELRFAASAAEARLRTAQAKLAAAEAALGLAVRRVARHRVRAPVTGRVLQVNIRAGEAVTVADGRESPIVLSQTGAPHVRVDIDEHDAWRFQSGMPAVARPRGNPAHRLDLRYVRTEPLVVPKRFLTGEIGERVDTRVLQMVFEVTGDWGELYIGQTVDVEIATSH